MIKSYYAKKISKFDYFGSDVYYFYLELLMFKNFIFNSYVKNYKYFKRTLYHVLNITTKN